MSMSIFFKTVDAEKLEEFIQSDNECLEDFANNNEINSTDAGYVGKYLMGNLPIVSNGDCSTPEQVKQSVKAFEEMDWEVFIAGLLEGVEGGEGGEGDEGEEFGDELGDDEMECIEDELRGVINEVGELLKNASEQGHALVEYVA